uniref:Uncharacterized protein n=1 Tax=Plectus sambesii TaxID=2011161 RepID=A0A914XPP6_9BILA
MFQRVPAAVRTFPTSGNKKSDFSGKWLRYSFACTRWQGLGQPTKLIRAMMDAQGDKVPSAKQLKDAVSKLKRKISTPAILMNTDFGLLRYWYEGAALGSVSTNNGLESLYGHIKRFGTLRKRMPIGSFVKEMH